tara:strand:- start:7569 stop:8729 length:1161 start_codon:yes stop_codon:yes gene_type:complete
MKFDMYIPTTIKFGEGRFEETAKIAEGMGKHTLIVTGRSSMNRLGYTQKLIASLESQAGIQSTVFNDVSASPTISEVDKGAQIAREVGVDFITALGGGSAIDVAKSIAAVLGGDASAGDYLHQRAQVSEKAYKIIAIPTTAGTGSELNKAGIVRDEEKQFKDGIRSTHLFPKFAIVDPELTYSMPKPTTAHTGFDALAHAIESYVSPKAQPATDAFSLAAIANISHYLPIALDDPTNVEARQRMAFSSMIMGYNLSSVGTCFPHRIDKALCAVFPEIAHGQSLALFYTQWAKTSWKGNVERFAKVTEIMDPTTASMSLERRAESFSRVIAEFIERIGLNKRLNSFGVTENDIPQLVERVAGDLSINPVAIKKETLPSIFKEILQPI